MSAQTIVAILLALAVVGAWLRLAWWQWRAPPVARARAWRLAVLAVAQPIVAGLLYLTLLPPAQSGGATTLVVATQGPPRIVAVGAGERLVALPEAGRVEGADRAPDLGSALRTHPGAGRVRVVGGGLGARDRDVAAQVSLAFTPPPVPTGLVALDPPSVSAPGGTFVVTARVSGIEGGSVELIDPAGRVVDGAAIPADGAVTLSGTARAPGVALFALRIRDRGKAIVEDAAVPLRTDAPPATRVVIAAAAPGPEVKALRRWASDAALSPAVRVGVGGGVSLGDARIDSAALASADAVILDDRAWDALSADARQTIAGAVRGGLGLVVRVTGPVPRGWQVIGLGVSGGGQTAPLVLPPAAPSDAMLAARRGPGTRDVPAAMAGPRDGVPVLTRQAAVIGGAVPVLRDAGGVVFAGWRAVGRGRVGIVTVADSFALVTSGHGDRFGEMWSAIVAAVARPVAGVPATIDALPRAGERTAICGAGGADVVAPDGRATALLIDPGTQGCAGYWPITAGWHRLTGPAQGAFYVYPAAALPGVRAAERRAATLALVRERGGVGAAEPVRGAAWPWFLGWLAAAAGLWWFERRGRKSGG